MDTEIISFICIIAGTFFLIRNVRMLKNDEYLRKYLETSPKGKAFVTKHGIDNAFKKTRQVFLPLGILIAIVLILSGLNNLFFNIYF